VLAIGAVIAGATVLLDRTGAAGVTTITLTDDPSGARPLVGVRATRFRGDDRDR
jgi:hypothetical protein